MDGRGAGSGLEEPLPPGLHALLRRATLDHATTERRRWFPPRVHVGVPGGSARVHAVRAEDRTDHALRTDVLAAMLAAVPAGVVRGDEGRRRTPLVWLTRPGELDLQDVDAEWLAAALAAGAEAGRDLTMVVVNRHGWRDPRSGLSRTWVRLRHR